MLWLGLWCEHLALECFADDGCTPLAITATVAGRDRVHACNAAARKRGVTAGDALAEALVRCAGLRLRRREPALERTALHTLAQVAYAYSAHVAFSDDDGLVLEVGASACLFGGLRALLRQLLAALADAGLRPRWAVAPTPRAAEWLCRSGPPRIVNSPAALVAALAALPLARVAAAAEAAALHGLGLRTLGEVCALPRAELAHRLGPSLRARIDQALDRLADPRPAYVPPARFHGRVELPFAVATVAPLLFAANRLLHALAGFLRAHEAGVERLRLQLHHDDGTLTALTLGLSRPSRDAGHLHALLRERCERLACDRAVTALALVVETLQPLAPAAAELFGDAAAADASRLVDRLRARLGHAGVHGLALHPDHRPERAWRLAEPGTVSTPLSRACRRPPWLLAQPQPLASVDGQPYHAGWPLRLLDGPERIEAGWWDGAPVARDYYVGEDAARRRLWIFRELHRPACWCLHGLFGLTYD